MKKNLLFAVLAVVLMTGLMTASASAEDLLERIRAKGSITIAMEGTWAPWTYHNEEDVLVGYDVEVGQKIAEHLGVTPDFIEGEWDGLLAGLEAGRYDLMINGVDITPEREKKYDFSQPYAYNRTAVIVRADDDRIQSMEDLKGMHTTLKNTSNVTSCLTLLQLTRTIQIFLDEKVLVRTFWWRQRDSNPRPYGCEPYALPAELCPHNFPIFPFSGMRLTRVAREIRRLTRNCTACSPS